MSIFFHAVFMHFPKFALLCSDSFQLRIQSDYPSCRNIGLTGDTIGLVVQPTLVEAPLSTILNIVPRQARNCCNFRAFSHDIFLIYAKEI